MIKIEKNNNTVRGLDTFSIHGDVKGNNRVGINDIEVVANKIDG